MKAYADSNRGAVYSEPASIVEVTGDSKMVPDWWTRGAKLIEIRMHSDVGGFCAAHVNATSDEWDIMSYSK